MKYNIFFGQFGEKKGYIVLNAKNEYPCVYDDILLALAQVRKADPDAHISLSWLDSKNVRA